jgi:hypothetical protein
MVIAQVALPQFGQLMVVVIADLFTVFYSLGSSILTNWSKAIANVGIETFSSSYRSPPFVHNAYSRRTVVIRLSDRHYFVFASFVVAVRSATRRTLAVWLR